MRLEPLNLSAMFQEFFRSEKSGGVLLLVCTVVSLLIANSPSGPQYIAFWHLHAGGLTVEYWINDALMAVFFLLIGLELERELYAGELSDLRNAALPVIAAIGGVAVPAAIHYALNAGSPTQDGIGIPMATDIAFALGVLAILGSRIPAALKVFLAALAVIDDLCAIAVIAVFYSAGIKVPYLAGALGVWALLILLNRLRVMALAPYLAGGALMWLLMFKSGVHPTVTGVMLAFAIPFSPRDASGESPSARLERWLHEPVAYFVMPLFALANTAIPVYVGGLLSVAGPNTLGIAAGLVIGKPVGIVLFSFLAVAAGICRLPFDLNWRHIAGAGMLGGIGFTMSMFITNLAFEGDSGTIVASKMAILAASLVAGVIGLAWLALFGKPVARIP
jgi:NhaA family Na+:H+ antiporter